MRSTDRRNHVSAMAMFSGNFILNPVEKIAQHPVFGFSESVVEKRCKSTYNYTFWSDKFLNGW